MDKRAETPTPERHSKPFVKKIILSALILAGAGEAVNLATQSGSEQAQSASAAQPSVDAPTSTPTPEKIYNHFNTVTPVSSPDSKSTKPVDNAEITDKDLTTYMGDPLTFASLLPNGVVLPTPKNKQEFFDQITDKRSVRIPEELRVAGINQADLKDLNKNVPCWIALDNIENCLAAANSPITIAQFESKYGKLQVGSKVRMNFWDANGKEQFRTITLIDGETKPALGQYSIHETYGLVFDDVTGQFTLIRNQDCDNEVLPTLPVIPVVPTEVMPTGTPIPATATPVFVVTLVPTNTPTATNTPVPPCVPVLTALQQQQQNESGQQQQQAVANSCGGVALQQQEQNNQPTETPTPVPATETPTVTPAPTDTLTPVATATNTATATAFPSPTKAPPEPTKAVSTATPGAPNHFESPTKAPPEPTKAVSTATPALVQPPTRTPVPTVANSPTAIPRPSITATRTSGPAASPTKVGA